LDMNNTITISIIIPLKDEARNIEPLAEELTITFNQKPWTWECIWVDDGSTDESLSVLDRLHREDPRHRFLSFHRHAGQSAALWAGFKEARGNLIATLDGDGQNDPSDLPRLIDMIYPGGWDMIQGYRYNRRDTPVRKLASYIANTFRNWVTGKTVRDVGCSTRVFRRECVECLPQYKGMHRFLPTFLTMQGYKIAEVPVNHRPRIHGKTKYNINNRLWIGLVDTLGVLWLKKRYFHYKISKRSG